MRTLSFTSILLSVVLVIAGCGGGGGGGGDGGTADTTVPTVTIVSPRQNDTCSGTVTVNVNASDNVGVSSVEFYVNNVKVSSLQSAPYTFNWNTTSLINGNSYVLAAKAYDAAQNTSIAALTVLVNNTLPDITAPTASITSPANSTVVNGVITVKADAGDNVGVSKVEFSVDGGLLFTDNSFPFQFDWNSTVSGAGVHQLTAEAYDAAGNSTTSAAVTVTTDIANPIVTGFLIPSSSNSMTVPITTFTATDDAGVTGYLITESSSAPSSSAAGWTTSVPTSFVFSGIGSRTAYAWVKDAAGHVSASLSSPVNITLTASLSTSITGSDAVCIVSINGASLPIMYGLEMTITYPLGLMPTSATPFGVALNSLVAVPNGTLGVIGATALPIGLAATEGFGSGQVIRVTFSNLPVGSLPSDFGISLTAIFGLGVQIQ